MQTFDPIKFRANFPYFNSHNLMVFFDSAATALKPECLLQVTNDFYASAGSVHRSQYSAELTEAYESARNKMAKFVNAENPQAIIWTSGTTHAINMIANGLTHLLQAGDEIIISEAEHHANFVTWFMLAKKLNLKLHILPFDENYQIDAQLLQQTLNAKTKVVTFNHTSNVTGASQDIAKLVAITRANSDALIVLDSAQAIAHTNIDVQNLDVDFCAFSAHKLYGPTGLGVLTGKLAKLELLDPIFYGGKMIECVSKDNISFTQLPYRLEAGTPNIAAIIGFSAVLSWLTEINLVQAEAYAVELANKIKAHLSLDPQIQIFSAPNNPVISFNYRDIHHADLATLLAEQSIALRVGQHCAMPYLTRLAQDGTLRVSIAAYNNQTEVELFCKALDKSLQLLRG